MPRGHGRYYHPSLCQRGRRDPISTLSVALLETGRYPSGHQSRHRHRKALGALNIGSRASRSGADGSGDALALSREGPAVCLLDPSKPRVPLWASSIDVDAGLTLDLPGKPAAPQPGGTIAFLKSDRPAHPRAGERIGDVAAAHETWFWRN
jgi:hypothetical protein